MCRFNTVYKVKFSTSTQHSHLLSTHADAIVNFKVLEGYSGHGLNTGLSAKFLDETLIFLFNRLTLFYTGGLGIVVLHMMVS